MELHRRFSPFTLLIISINGMVGSAWLFAPLYAAKIAGASAMLAWVIGGVGTIIVALTFAELSVITARGWRNSTNSTLSHGTLTRLCSKLGCLVICVNNGAYRSAGCAAICFYLFSCFNSYGKRCANFKQD